MAALAAGALAVGTAWGVPPRALAAQEAASTAETHPGSRTASDGWRFPVGEETVYDVAVGLGSVAAPRPVGRASLSVQGVEEVDGTEAYRAVLEVEGSIPLVYSLHNRQVSWIATDPIRSLRFEEHKREGDYRRHRLYRMHPEAGTYTRFDRDEDDGGWRRVEEEAGVPTPPDALDEVSFLYFIRTLPLEVGRSYEFRRYFEEDGNPVVLEVLRRERVRVPAGRFRTLVVRPVLQTDGLFSQEGRAEVFLTDDDRRLIVQIRSRMKVGTVNLHLRRYSPGEEGAAPDAAPGG